MHSNAHAPWARALGIARFERGWTQRQVADHLDVSTVTISRWEQGIHRPYAYHIHALCTLFGKTREELGFVAGPAIPRQDEVAQPPTDAHIVMEHLGLSCCLQGWIASLGGHNDQAESYLRLAADAFARCQSPLERTIQELRGALALRETPQRDPGDRQEPARPRPPQHTPDAGGNPSLAAPLHPEDPQASVMPGDTAEDSAPCGGPGGGPHAPFSVDSPLYR